MFAASPSFAQTPPQPAQPALVVPQGSPIDRERQPRLPQTAPGLGVPAPPPAAAFAPGQTVRVVSAAVTGSTIIAPPQLSAITADLTGPSVDLSRIEQARQALLARYRAGGYLLSTVSTVVDRAGNLRFNVIEGYIADVRLEGDIGPAGTQVLRFLNRITRERPVRIATIERYLLLATDVPGVTLRSVLRPATDDPAAITLVATVSRKAADGLLLSDNRAFRQTGPEQFLAVAGFNSFTSLGERTELSLLRAYNDTETFGQAATEFFVGGSGFKIRLYGGAGDTTPSGNIRALGYDGFTRVFGGQLSYPVIRSREETLLAIASLDAIESDVRTNLGGSGTMRSSFDSLRILRAGPDYTLQDQLLGDDRTGVNTVSLRFSQGLNALGASVNDPTPGRQGSRTSFFKFGGEITRTQVLFHPWTNATFQVFGLVAGQVSNAVLPPSEEFFLGGIRYNRGFYAGEVTGDNALTTSVELQLNTTVAVSAFGQSIDIGAQYYIFHDWGETWQNQQQDLNHVLHSIGGGARTQLTSHLGLEVEAVERLTRQPQGSSSGASTLRGEAVYWRAIVRF